MASAHGDPTRCRTRRALRWLFVAALFAMLVSMSAALALGDAGSPANGSAPQSAEDAAGTAQNTDDSAGETLLARPSTSGRLSVQGTQLVDAHGRAVVLRGVSMHGLLWFPEYVNTQLFGQLSREWGCNLVRLAMYSQDYCDGKQNESLEVLRRGIQACIDNDMYVLVDWHTLVDSNPNINLDQAKEFFALISAEYADCPNVIFEICNEPNGETTWSDIRSYAEEVIPVIRQASPDALVIVGTSTFDRDLMMAARNPLDFSNVMYTLHFYAATHGEDLRGELKAALDAGLPVFVTECGICEASGDGSVDYDSAVEWFELLRDNNISFAVWSLSNKSETSAFIRHRSSATTSITDDDLTPVGMWVRSLIQGVEPRQIPQDPAAKNGILPDPEPDWLTTLDGSAIRSVEAWGPIALAALGLVAVGIVASGLYQKLLRTRRRTYDSLPGLGSRDDVRHRIARRTVFSRIVITISSFFTLIYLTWRVVFSIPVEYGWVAVTANVVLFVVEALGFVESVIHYTGMANIRESPLPHIEDDEFPEVDIFISTYNEPEELLRQTINGCNHLAYPDKRKVHVWVCDDNHRQNIKQLAAAMGVGYFDREDHEGAKAGNLNHALSLTSAPYVVTLDADMIPRSSFLLKTIPYFVDAEKRCADLPEDEKVHLGFVQSPQCFYEPDIFQHDLYCEKFVPNEQDFFYRSIEVAKTSTNSVIYGGSNTVLSRRALEDIGGFYTESITEDFATGMLIQSAGYVSLGISEPLASGCTPRTFKEHVQQRTRWGRGVIVTARKLHILRRKELTFLQKMSYWSSAVYWYSPVKNLIYMCAPLLFAVFFLPVFDCSWLDLLVFWLPMFATQTLCLRVISGNSISTKWSGIRETSVMPHLLVPILKESLGITLSTFKVTDKSSESTRRKADLRAMAPFIVLGVLSVFGIARVVWLISAMGMGLGDVGLFVLLFWLVRNLYYIVMSLFLIDGRDRKEDLVRVIDAIPARVSLVDENGAPLEDIATHDALDRIATLAPLEGIATVLTKHSVRLHADEGCPPIGTRVQVSLEDGTNTALVNGVVIGKSATVNGSFYVFDVEILDYVPDDLPYLQLFYDRVPSLPQTLRRDIGILPCLWRNITHHLQNLGS